MNWFERLTGFPETTYEETRAKLRVEGKRLHSLVNGKSYGIGQLELVPLQTLRERARGLPQAAGRLRVSVVRGDVRQMHRAGENAGALFQVASQFNLLEMTGPTVTPEEGVARYESDHTQGPACAIAAGAATIYRNYFAPVGQQSGQTADVQLNGLSDLGRALSAAVGRPVQALWDMRNGYALCTRAGLEEIATYLLSLDPAQLDRLRGKLRIGLHWDVEVTDGVAEPRPAVSQAFCSALPVAYAGVRAAPWEPFARLILEGAYEATLWAGVLNAARAGSNVVFLTFVGGGAFGNDEGWIRAAIRRALKLVSQVNLDVRLVTYGAPSQSVLQLVEEYK